MSFTAEFASTFHNVYNRPNDRTLIPFDTSSVVDKVTDIKVIIFDLYGTLVNYWRPEFTHEAAKENVLLDAFKKTIDYFQFEEYLLKINPKIGAEKTLKDFYHGLILINNDKKVAAGATFPEVKIEDIWYIIAMMIQRHGYKFEDILECDDLKEFARCVAYVYNFYAHGRGLFEGVFDTLRQLKKNNFRLGIVSNGQFYSTLDLTLFLREQSGNTLDDHLELFDPDLIHLSYEYGVARPNNTLFGKLYDALYELDTLPKETLFVGNDLLLDIDEAQKAGMKTALFTGDKDSTFLHDKEHEIVPDLTFSHWNELPQKVSFYQAPKK